MNITINCIPKEKKYVIRNLMELYLYDMSDFDDEYKTLEVNDAGLFDYDFLDFYWTEEGRFPYIIYANNKLAGLSLIRTVEVFPRTFEVAEFFILRKYRNKGLGSALIDEMFLLHKGNWTIDTHIKNVVAQNFWRNVVKKNAGSEYEEIYIQHDTRIMWTFHN